MNRSLGKFQKFLSLERGVGDLTIEAYLGIVASLERWIGERNKIVSEMKREDWLAWRASLSNKASITINKYLCAARAYCKYLVANQAMVASTMPDFVIKIKAQEPTNVPSAAQFLAMREKAKAFDLERQALLEVPAGTGLRIDALVTLQTKHLRLDVDRPHIIVDSDMACKGCRAGIVPITPYVAALLRQILKDKMDFSNLVIRATKEGIRRFIRSLSPAELPLVPHSMRHFYVCMMYWRNLNNQRFNVVWVRDAAGHGNLTTTDRYLRAANVVCDSDALWETWAYGAPLTAAATADKEKEN